MLIVDWNLEQLRVHHLGDLNSKLDNFYFNIIILLIIQIYTKKYLLNYKHKLNVNGQLKQHSWNLVLVS